MNKKTKGVKSTTPNTAKAKAKAGKTKKVAMKLIVLNPPKDRSLLERGGEFLKLRKQGFKQGQVIRMYANAGIEVSTPAYYNAVKIARAPQEVRDAIREGKVAPTLVLPFLKKKLSPAQIVERLNELVAQREKHSKFLEKSGFGDSSETALKLTKGRIIGLIGKKLQKIQKSEALTDVRGQAVLAFIKQLENTHDAQAIDDIVAEFSGKKGKKA